MNLLSSLTLQIVALKKARRSSHDKGPFHYGMARPQVADGGTASNMDVATNILNEHSVTAYKGWYCSLGVGRSTNKSSP
jgi:hypothetical protein